MESTHHHIKLSIKELHLVDKLRTLKCSEFLEQSNDPRLNKTIRLVAFDGDRLLGHCYIDAGNMPLECAEAGVKLEEKIKAGEYDELHPNDIGIPCADDMESIVTQTTQDEVIEDKSALWKSVMEDVIPPCVEAIHFTIREGDLTTDRRKELEEYFPGVVIQNAFASKHEVLSTPELQIPGPENGVISLDQLRDLQVDTIEPNPPEKGSQNHHPNGHLDSSPNSQDVECEVENTDIPSIGDTSEPSTSLVSLGTPVLPEIDDQICRSKRVNKMYSHWKKKREVQSFAGRRSNVEKYFGDLIDLYKLAYHSSDATLAYAVLVRFQSTSYSKNLKNPMPLISTVAKAFEDLPTDSPMCRWIVILFSFLWPTESKGDYNDLRREYPNIDQIALAKLMYGIAWTRCLLTTGHDAAVLSRWCDVHEHDEDSSEKALCDIALSQNTIQVAKAVELEDNEKIRNAEELIRKHGGVITWEPKSAKRATSLASSCEFQTSEMPSRNGSTPTKTDGSNANQKKNGSEIKKTVKSIANKPITSAASSSSRSPSPKTNSQLVISRENTPQHRITPLDEGNLSTEAAKETPARRSGRKRTAPLGLFQDRQSKKNWSETMRNGYEY